MPTVNIYVSKNLKTQMDEFDFNWSQLAAKSFQNVIDRTAIDVEMICAMKELTAKRTRENKSAAIFNF